MRKKKKKKKTFNSSAGLVDMHFPPPMYKDYCSKVTKSKHDVESIFNVDNRESLSDNNDDNIADDNDDSDCDPTWGNASIISNKGSDDSNSEENILIQSSSNAVFSPNTQVWKVNHLNRYEQTEIAPNFQGVHKSPGKWNISSTNNQTEDAEALKHVTKTLVLDANNKNLSKNVNDGDSVTTKSADNLHSSINFDGGMFMSSHDFQKFTFTSLTHLKYDMSAMMHIIKDTNEKVQALMAQSNNNFISTISPKQNSIDMNIFPLTSDDGLMAEEKKLDDTHYRNELICKLSLLVDNNNLNNSVRRIISRLCDDTLLLSYSLTGFKHNKPFGSLKIYQVIIDAVRLNLQYAKVPDKKIDVPLRVWLDHAKFRIKEKNEKKNKDIKLIN
ncbi:uncharacterized protein LOC132953345 [Metopolophium dirhodum]|uniref:uncharacterized protein LOC132945215 n=1 Tax=Metopolophium dirhodum TaxID=44670 RepID=UPI00298FE0DB|nr:uncharacterized protein LOC132945215 [Metopolophium dirhodum]XP_060870873.1 uncharacterized protein LOC132945215 [Metopolophium dirhodum]XP_060881820.1 uncharacterized protein LOC132953345 [Metopolophium dirhodum]